MENFHINENININENNRYNMNSSFEDDKKEINSKASPNITLINGMDNNDSNSNKKSNLFNGSYDSKIKGIYPLFNKKKNSATFR